MVDVLNLQEDGPDLPDEQKASNPSYVLCAGQAQSNRSRWLC
jgi:hypothetical protein